MIIEQGVFPPERRLPYGFRRPDSNLPGLERVVSAVAEVEEQGVGIATAFLSLSQYRQVIVTARHCFARDTKDASGRSPLVEREVRFPDSTRVSVDPATAYPVPADKDLLVIPLKREISIPPIQISENRVADVLSGSRRIACIGYPGDSDPLVSFGVIEDANMGRGDFIVSAQVAPGSSGGPVIDESGQAVGLLYGIFGYGMAYFLKNSGVYVPDYRSRFAAN